MLFPADWWEHVIAANTQAPWNGADPVTIVSWSGSAIQRQWVSLGVLKSRDFSNVRGWCADIDELWPPAGEENVNDALALLSKAVDVGGRPGKYDWEAAICAVWAEIYNGDLRPEDNRPALHKFMVDWFAGRDLYPDEGEIRKRTKKIEAALKTTDG
jgi:hypothetical protein